MAHLRNAGVLFFARDVRRFFDQAYITYLLAKGTDKVHVLDRKDFAGGVVADIEESLRFIERDTRTAYRIERLQRGEIPEYPAAALREAVTNAVMHRDWFNEGANVFVEIYADRIEVSSPGGLPKGMRPADPGHKSVRRNALLADLLHRISFIEKAGTGIKRMRDTARDQGCPEPEFSENSFFTAVFFPDPEVRALMATPEVTPDVTGEVALLTALRGELDRRALQAALGLKDEEHFRKAYLLPALSAGLIAMTLPDKPRSSKQRYRITPSGEDALKRHRADND
jgi:ATP-dependent DNA helicase RecG